MIEMCFKVTSNEQLVLYADVFPQQKKREFFSVWMNLQPKETPHSEYWRELENETMDLKYFKTLIVEFETGKAENRNAFLCKGNRSSMVNAEDGTRQGDLEGIETGRRRVLNRYILTWFYTTCIAWVYPC